MQSEKPIVSKAERQVGLEKLWKRVICHMERTTVKKTVMNKYRRKNREREKYSGPINTINM